MDEINELVARLVACSDADVLDRTVADNLMNESADALEAQQKRIEELERECRQQSAGVLVLASQRANYLERAEKAEAERDELARTIDLLNVERSKAETALAECIRLSDAMAKHNDAYFIKSEALDAFRTWRAKQ